MNKKCFFALVTLLTVTSSARAWWDTQVRAQQPWPLVQELAAPDGAGARDVRADAQADGGRGGDAVLLRPGETLGFSVELPRSVYAVWAIARALEDEMVLLEGDDREQEFDLPGGTVTIRTPRKPVYLSLKITPAAGDSQEWYMPIAFRTDYAVVGSLYFPLHVPGPCRIEIGLNERSEHSLLFQRFEIRDTLGGTARVAAKTQRMLTSDEELAALRDDPGRHRLPPERTIEQRRERADQIWDSAPPLNLMTADPLFRGWRGIMGAHGRGGVNDVALAYERTGNLEAAWDGAVMLCAIAEKYPGLDHYYSEVSGHANFNRENTLIWGSRGGKTVYSGHEPGRLKELATAYDRLFDAIKDNQDLADYVNTRIPWVKTPADVIELLDTHILQHGMDCLNRRVMRSDPVSAFIPLVQGVNQVSHAMLENGLFKRVHYNMADAGGLDDQVFTSFNRGGVHYVGATGYVGPALSEIAGILGRYVAAGGDRRFDMNNPELYPHMPEAELTKQKLHAAGGFPFIIGDSMDLRRPRLPDIPSFPSRYVEGFGAIVLESGQTDTNPLVKRAVAIRTGIGRGHAHQDTLNLEMFAHGTRLAPDLGGRHEGNLRATPNMRINRMHNLVEIDERNFENSFPGSTVSATGWPTALAALPGSHYAAAAARATSHPEVSLYHRATAMIDGDTGPEHADVYLFDVFRVAGGRVHTYCFHGAPTADENRLDTNVSLEPASSDTAMAYMAARPEASRQEGRAGDYLRATWELDEDMRRHYQRDFFKPDQPVGLTLHLFGRENDHVMVGSAQSDAYPVAMPYLHVQGRQADEGRVSVYPALYEAWSGQPFMGAQRELKVEPADPDDARRGVALEVEMDNDRRDLLFASRRPEIIHQVEGGLRVNGEYALLSEDAQGLRLLHLVGGTEIERDDIRVSAERGVHTARITAADWRNHGLTLSDPMPEGLLDGALARIGNERHWSAFELDRVSGTNARVLRTPRYYQSNIEFVDAENRLVATELEPMVYGSDTRHADGTTVTNEDHDRYWKATLEPRERWMYLGWPGTELSYPDTVEWDDVPDADGDGRRTLRLLTDERDTRATGVTAGDVLLEMEVTRVDPENNLFYFRMPENPEYQAGGWQFVRREIVNEDGSKRWLASYPGTTFSWLLEGNEPVADALFTADDHGNRKLYAYHFGPDDIFEVPTFVHVARVEPGVYAVRANVPCIVSLPGIGEVRLSAEALREGAVMLHEERRK